VLLISTVVGTSSRILYENNCFIILSHDRSGYRRGFGLMTDSLDSLIQRVTTPYSTLLHTHTHTHTHTIVFTVTSSLPLLGSDFQKRTFPSSEFPNGPQPQLPAPNRNSSQRLILSSSLPHSLIHFGTDRIESTVPLLLFTGRCLLTAFT
jgi:hypothetical protein